MNTKTNKSQNSQTKQQVKKFGEIEYSKLVEQNHQIGDGSKTGKFTGLGITQWFNLILFENVKQKKDDNWISKMFYIEFDKREKHQPLSRIRSFYNTGRYGFGKSPDKLGKLREMDKQYRAVKYDSSGNVVKGGFGGNVKQENVLDKLMS